MATVLSQTVALREKQKYGHAADHRGPRPGGQAVRMRMARRMTRQAVPQDAANSVGRRRRAGFLRGGSTVTRKRCRHADRPQEHMATRDSGLGCNRRRLAMLRAHDFAEFNKKIVVNFTRRVFEL